MAQLRNANFERVLFGVRESIKLFQQMFDKLDAADSCSQYIMQSGDEDDQLDIDDAEDDPTVLRDAKEDAGEDEAKKDVDVDDAADSDDEQAANAQRRSAARLATTQAAAEALEKHSADAALNATNPETWRIISAYLVTFPHTRKLIQRFEQGGDLHTIARHVTGLDSGPDARAVYINKFFASVARPYIASLRDELQVYWPTTRLAFQVATIFSKEGAQWHEPMCDDEEDGVGGHDEEKLRAAQLKATLDTLGYQALTQVVSFFLTNKKGPGSFDELQWPERDIVNHLDVSDKVETIVVLCVNLFWLV